MRKGLIIFSIILLGTGLYPQVSSGKAVTKNEKGSIIDGNNIKVNSNGVIVDVKTHSEVTGKVKIKCEADGRYVIYTVKNGKLDGESVAYTGDNKKIGYGYYSNGKKNGKFVVEYDNIKVSSEYKNNKMVGYKFYMNEDGEILEYTVNGKKINMNVKAGEGSGIVKGTVVSGFSNEKHIKITGDLYVGSKKDKSIKNEDIPYLPIDAIFSIGVN